jgi:hypothetical protein
MLRQPAQNILGNGRNVLALKRWHSSYGLSLELGCAKTAV